MVWYRPADEATELRQLLTDERGTVHAISIPPPLIRCAAIDDMRAAAERLLAPQFRAVVRLIDEPILQPIYEAIRVVARSYMLVVKPLKLYGEMHQFLPAIASEMGVRIDEVVVNHRARIHGRSSSGISRTMAWSSIC